MRVYHGSNVIVKEPKLILQNRGLDFGVGFYTTSNRKQAEDFTIQVAMRNKTDARFVTVYDYDALQGRAELDLLRFAKPDDVWLEFVRQNRFRTYGGEAHDIIIGPVANDDVFATLQAYFAGILTQAQTLDALKIKELYDQYVFKNEKAFSYLRYIDAYMPEGV